MTQLAEALEAALRAHETGDLAEAYRRTKQARDIERDRAEREQTQ